ncbi:hypothetical protein EDF18_2131 [Frigoribacterium sp. PhB107]|nr:hypothetical protein EDF18_2131 [Frigoribacterium sp. PhB107]
MNSTLTTVASAPAGALVPASRTFVAARRAARTLVG